MSPRKTTRLNTETVVQAAVRLINAEGPGALTLNRLADQLGIQTPSLYNHVDGMPGLMNELSVCNARMFADRLSEAAIGKSGEDLFRSAAQAFRDHVKENPGLYLATLRASGTQPVVNEMLERQEQRVLKIGLVMMASLGLQGEDAVHGLRAFRSAVHGFATLEAAGGFGLPQDCDESFSRLVEILVRGLRHARED